jgi:uroporphyrinogen III methyltransferase/synthase
LVEALERHGASVIVLPTIEIRRLASTDLDAALRGENTYDWTLFTSANTVRMVIQRAGELGIDPASLAHLGSVAAIGSATARDLELAGIRVDLQPEHATAESLADALIACGVDGKRVFLPASRIARRVLPEQLEAAGAEVVATPLYDTVCPDRVPDDALAAVRDGNVEVVTFTSPSTVRNFLALAGFPPDGTIIASIGPVTSAEAVRLGLPVVITAGEHSAEGLARAIVDHQISKLAESENE